MKGVVIRPFEEKDAIPVEDILKVIGWADQYIVGQLECIKKLCRSSTGEVFVATYEEMIVGFIQVEHHQWNRLSYLHGLVVHPDFRRLGIAKNLVEEVELSCKNKQQRGISVDTPVDNLGGKRFYTSIGFNEAYIMPEFYESGLDGMTFQKFFQPKRKTIDSKENMERISACKLLYRKNVDTKIAYLSGKPGVGKYTIAKVLSNKHGFIICDNQLINNPIFELLQYDGYTKIPDFAWDSIARIRIEVLDFLTKVCENSYVLTNNLYEDNGDRDLYEQVKKMAELRGSIFVPIRLLINEQEHLKRVVQPERRARWKSIDSQDAYDNTPLLSISHPHLLELDVSNLSAEEAANIIAHHIKSLKS